MDRRDILKLSAATGVGAGIAATVATVLPRSTRADGTPFDQPSPPTTALRSIENSPPQSR